MFTEKDYERLHEIVFRPDYPGYRPTVKEIPNGDGKVDAEKRYAHVAPKYFQNYDGPGRGMLEDYYDAAHNLAQSVAQAWGFDPFYFPHWAYGALRVLDYPPGAGSNEHTDFDLFTLMMYRDRPECFVHTDEQPPFEVRMLNAQAHLGEIGSEFLGKAPHPHKVLKSVWRQRSIVYFAIPDHQERLPSGETVGEWLNGRLARSRVGT